ncbi:helix-turn-helix domain-containing protein [Kordia sp. SMS9]|uniref:helix-turn-helix domain-containing protein n=1 Tax=Kordia sp. SMS9 TaxID=2282170 RepID=UPI000E0DB04F|nr:helix-turn-helix domain-containing protein [Kordia sp. SMS9]
MIIITIHEHLSFLWRNVLLSSIFIFSCAISFAQEISEFTIPDSLQSKTYEALITAFASDKKDSIGRLIYANTYFAKANKAKDTLEMTRGYELLAFAYAKDYPRSFVYYDKAIALSKDLKHKRYPAMLYTFKGAVLSTDGKYAKAMENHLKALEYADKNDNIELVYVNKHNIGLLKKYLELYDEALEIFKECYRYELNNENRKELDFALSHFSIAEIYIETKVLDSAIKYNTKGYQIALQQNFTDLKNLFLLNKGIIFYHQGKYAQAIQQINTAMDSLQHSREKLIIMNSFFHVAKSYDSLQKPAKAIVYYKKVDSVFTEHPHHISSTIMNTYKSLYNYYRSVNDKKNEMLYIEKALVTSNLNKKDYRTLSNKIIKTFDRRKLLQKQKELNKALNQKDKSYSVLKRVSLLVLCIFMIVLLAFYAKQRQIKKRFKEFVQQHEQTVRTPKKAANIDTEDVKKIGLAKEVIDQILAALDDFESKKLFIESDNTLPNLSKRFKTNSAYLSKVVNTYKNKKFAEYLNDLRIEHAIEKIQTDKQFRLYTIKAIALEVGFNNSQSFARAFKRKTGIKPSDFITQLESMKS